MPFLLWVVARRSTQSSGFQSAPDQKRQEVAEEMELLNRKYGVKALTFMDDDFNSDRQKMVDMLEELEKKKLDMSGLCLAERRT